MGDEIRIEKKNIYINLNENSLTKRQRYNLDQAFEKLKHDLNDETMNYKIIDVKKILNSKTKRIIIEFIYKGQAKKTFLLSNELRSIKDIIKIIKSIL